MYSIDLLKTEKEEKKSNQSEIITKTRLSEKKNEK
jgi:hypothetical protein